MNVVSHALLPGLAAIPLLPRSGPKPFFVSAAIVALAGALPDVLHPHLSLAARYASWPHTVYAWAAFAVVCAIVAFRRRIRSADASRNSSAGPALTSARLPLTRPLLLAPLAYVSHLLLDAISGGIAWMYPFHNARIGIRLIRFEYWFLIDAVLCVTAFVVLSSVQQRGWSAPPAAKR